MARLTLQNESDINWYDIIIKMSRIETGIYDENTADFIRHLLDENGAEETFKIILFFDRMEIYGKTLSNIWFSICDQNLENLNFLINLLEKNILKKESLIHALSSY